MLSRVFSCSVIQSISRRFLSLSTISQTTQPLADTYSSDAATLEDVTGTISQQPQSTIPLAGAARQQYNREAAPVLASQVTGTVKWFDPAKGYGFIMRNDSQEDCFVHFTGIAEKNPQHTLRTLDEGESVVFDVIQGARGQEAFRVTGPGGAPVRGSPFGERPMGGFGRGAPGAGRFGFAGSSSGYGVAPPAAPGYGAPTPNYGAPSAGAYGGAYGGPGYASGSASGYGGQQGGYGGQPGGYGGAQGNTY